VLGAVVLAAAAAGVVPTAAGAAARTAAAATTSTAAATASALPASNCPTARSGAQYTAPPVPGGGKTVALTFDDGPGPSTVNILSILEFAGVRATFFNTGLQSAKWAGDVRGEEAAGYLLGDHTWDHASLTSLSAAGQASELDREAAEQKSLVGTAPCAMRPPYGNYDSTTVSVAASRHMTTWLWDVDPEDWKAAGSGSSYWVNRIISLAESEGGQLRHPIIVLHNQGIPMPATVAALPVIINYFEAHGYTFVDLLGRTGPPRGCGAAVPVSLPATLVDGGTTLRAGDVVRSPGNQYRLVMQSDGNLVEYTEHRALWSSGTFGHSGARAVMQSDGNLVVYSSSGRPLWSSHTFGHPGAGLRLRNDGELRVMSGVAVLWSSHTVNAVLRPGEELRPGWYLQSAGSACRLTITRRGNVVLRSASGAPLWRSGRHQGGKDRLRMQADGNLVEYTSQGAVWSSGTFGHPGDSLYLSRDGTAFVEAGGGAVAWFRP
jgi:peptidoglycan/xylan/chitin deacetylase (PgdA/CDA1 family)